MDKAVWRTLRPRTSLQSVERPGPLIGQILSGCREMSKHEILIHPRFPSALELPSVALYGFQHLKQKHGEDDQLLTGGAAVLLSLSEAAQQRAARMPLFLGLRDGQRYLRSFGH